ncbi:hypothetical protein DID76_02380 [Candidatus Marinamargulisbacteria bacterium SCGC AG-414-C22]|nr:hypothetical protein DID76_02380 [Candidatus Marinamargulisbacteria bacterium SCGC AG-414-C22]
MLSNKLKPLILKKNYLSKISISILGLTAYISGGFTNLIGIKISWLLPIASILIFLILLTTNTIYKKFLPPNYLIYILFTFTYGLIVGIASLLQISDISISTYFYPFFSLLSFFITLITVVSLINKKKDLQLFIYALNISNILLIILAIYTFLTDFHTLVSLRFNGGINANSFGNMGLNIFMFNQFISSQHKNNNTLKAFNLITLVQILASGSRACYLCLVFYMLFSKWNIKKTGILLIFFVFIGATTPFLPTQMVEETTKRLNIYKRISNNQETRLKVWKHYITSITPQIILIGKGPIQINKEIYKYDPHNIFISKLYKFGFLGLLLFLFAWHSLYKDLKKTTLNKNTKKEILWLFYFWIILFMFGDFDASRTLWIVLAFFMSVIKLSKKKNSNLIENH